MCPAPSDILLSLLAILFPPLAVWIKRGLCGADSLINIALCCLGFLPGLVHAWYIIATTPDSYEYERVVDVEGAHPYIGPELNAGTSGHAGGNVGSGANANTSFYYVRTRGSAPAEQFGAPTTLPQQGTQLGYGSIGAGQAVGGSGNEVPPTYDDAIKGDNKVQRS